MNVLASVESLETSFREGKRQPLVTSLRSFPTLPNGTSFLYRDSLALTGAHSLSWPRGFP